MKLILASASPRRAQILRHAGLRFEIARVNLNERRQPGETAREMTRRLAQAKASAAIKKLGKQPPESIVIGADTIVEVHGELLGKPPSPAAAREMLRKLSGKTHLVLTSVAAIRLPIRTQEMATESTRVRFAPLSADEIAKYVATGEPLGKAGAYAVQGIGGRFIQSMEGCYFNVVGLPLARLYRMLVKLGWQPVTPKRRRRAAG